MKIYDSIEEWRIGTSELRKKIAKNIVNMRTGDDPNIVSNSKRVNDVLGGVRFIIDLGPDIKKLNDKISIKDLYKNQL